MLARLDEDTPREDRFGSDAAGTGVTSDLGMGITSGDMGVGSFDDGDENDCACESVRSKGKTQKLSIQEGRRLVAKITRIQKQQKIEKTTTPIRSPANGGDGCT